jgi:hypothetical protein
VVNEAIFQFTTAFRDPINLVIDIKIIVLRKVDPQCVQKDIFDSHLAIMATLAAILYVYLCTEIIL